MPSIDCLITAPVIKSPRVLQLSGLFDVPPTERSEKRFQIQLPIENIPWNVGLIVGPSGSGKTTVSREAFGGQLVTGYQWPADKSIVDGFPASMGIKDITGLLSSVGFSSPPSWLRPFRCLSNGEQFRVTLARAMAESPELACIDEFTSVVDRTVAQIGSAAVSKSVRTANRKLIAVSCHYDIIEWLDPDWILEMPAGNFTRRLLRRRPKIELEIKRVHHSAWEIFKHAHYLSADLSVSAKCFVAFFHGQPVAFTSTIHSPSGSGSFWREHRTVCLPDFQGVGIGNMLSEYLASMMICTDKKYMSTTSSPSMIIHRRRSPLWKLHRAPSFTSRDSGERRGTSKTRMTLSRASNRLTAGFQYVGPANRQDAIAFGIIQA